MTTVAMIPLQRPSSTHTQRPTLRVFCAGSLEPMAMSPGPPMLQKLFRCSAPSTGTVDTAKSCREHSSRVRVGSWLASTAETRWHRRQGSSRCEESGYHGSPQLPEDGLAIYYQSRFKVWTEVLAAPRREPVLTGGHGCCPTYSRYFRFACLKSFRGENR